MFLTLPQLVLYGIIAQFLFLILLCVVLKGRRPLPRLLLAVMLTGMTGTLLEVFLHTTGFVLRYPETAFTGTILGMLQPGAIFLYAQSVMYRDFRLRLRHFAHLLPVLGAAAVFVVGYYRLSTEEQVSVLSDSRYPGVMNSVVLAIALHTIMLAYLAATLKKISRFGVELRQIFSDLDNKELGWLRNLLLAYTTAWALSLVYCLLAHILRVTGSHEWLTIATTGVSIAILLPMSVLAFQQPALFAGIRPASASKDAAPRISTAGQPPEPPTEQIRQLMEEQRPYLHSNLTVDRLARLAGLSPRDLSQFLNQQMGRNFYEFVNGYRIEHARQRLADLTEKATITDIMYESGFNSKSVFNTLFRETTGKTPSQYRRSFRNNG
ncbi:MAG: AraC family transcriptional regulator [Marinobacter sp.]|uniref:helix-turn-helix domain-containing protein n=1 Tax=Marinobacter sp. TaxID=50741 RepID=UPI00396E48BD